MKNNLITVSEAATILDICPQGVRRHIASGTLPAKRYGKRMLLLQRTDVENFQKRPSGRPRKMNQKKGSGS